MCIVELHLISSGHAQPWAGLHQLANPCPMCLAFCTALKVLLPLLGFHPPGIVQTSLVHEGACQRRSVAVCRQQQPAMRQQPSRADWSSSLVMCAPSWLPLSRTGTSCRQAQKSVSTSLGSGKACHS